MGAGPDGSRAGGGLTARVSVGAHRERWAWAFCWALGMALAVWAGMKVSREIRFTQADASAYLAMASGRAAMLPFAWRPLGPMLVRGLCRLTGKPVEWGFLVENAIALGVFFALTLGLLVRSGAPRWMLPAVAGIFFWAQQYSWIVFPDLTYAALLAAFLWLLSRERRLAAACVLFPLCLARESAGLAMVCLLMAGWKMLRRREVVAAVVATAAGLGVVRVLAAGALPDRERLPEVLYLAGKMPWNLAKNVFGLELWATVYPACAVPRWQMALHLGPLRALGFCGFSAVGPTQTLGAALAVFGLLPLLLLKVRRRDDLLVRFCVLYGAVSFLLAPLEGNLVWRLLGYGWPLFLVAVPRMVRGGFGSSLAAWGFVAVHLAVAWSVWWVFFVRPVTLLEVEVVGYGMGWGLLRAGWQADAVGEATAHGLCAGPLSGVEAAR